MVAQCMEAMGNQEKIKRRIEITKQLCKELGIEGFIRNKERGC